jgi:glycosyltransferase involved in cell wall biosynthesis
MKLSVVIPCLNEAQTLEKAIGLARDLIAAAAPGDGEVVVGDNGSTDGSQEIAQRAGARVVPIPRRGYGFALLGAIRASQGEIIVMGDADATYDFREAAPLVAAVADKSCDLAMGSRLHGNIEPGAMPFLHRWLGTPVLSWLIRRLFGMRISDCNCGMRAFSRDAFERMKLVSGGMEFASEMLVKSSLAGLRVREFPISLLRDTRDRTPHLHTWRDGWRHLRFILLFAPKVLFQIPGTILTVLFGLQTLLLLPGPLVVGPILFDYHHLFYTVPFFLAGVQLLWLNAFARHFNTFSGLTSDRATTRFPLEFWLVSGSLLALAGIGLFLYILAAWLEAGRHALLAIRPCALALLLFLVGALCAMNAFMTSMLELRFDQHSD